MLVFSNLLPPNLSLNELDPKQCWVLGKQVFWYDDFVYRYNNYDKHKKIALVCKQKALIHNDPSKTYSIRTPYFRFHWKSIHFYIENFFMEC